MSQFPLPPNLSEGSLLSRTVACCIVPYVAGGKKLNSQPNHYRDPGIRCDGGGDDGDDGCGEARETECGERSCGERYHGRCGQCEILYVKCQQRVLMLRHRASSRFGPGCSGGDARSDATAARRVVLIYEDASNISRRNSVFMENPVFEFVEGEGAAPQTFLQLVDGQLQPSSGIEPSFTYMGSDMSTKSRSIAQITTLTRPL